jgi:hypothetical protein
MDDGLQHNTEDERQRCIRERIKAARRRRNRDEDAQLPAGDLPDDSEPTEPGHRDDGQGTETRKKFGENDGKEDQMGWTSPSLRADAAKVEDEVPDDAGNETRTDPAADRQRCSNRIMAALPDLKTGKVRFLGLPHRLLDSGIIECLNKAAHGTWDLLELFIRNADRDVSGIAHPRPTTMKNRLALTKDQYVRRRLRLLERGDAQAGIPPGLLRRVRKGHWTMQDDVLTAWVLRLEDAKKTREEDRNTRLAEQAPRGGAARWRHHRCQT